MDWFPLYNSLRIAGISTVIIFFLGIIVAYYIARLPRLLKGEHLMLPIVTLVVISVGSLMRYTRTNMLEVLNADFIRTARAKGLSEKKVIYHHAFRNTLIPLVTIIGGSLPGLFSGALITETLYSIQGIGYISYQCMVGGHQPGRRDPADGHRRLLPQPERPDHHL